MPTGEVRFVTASDGVKLAAHVSGSGPPLYTLHGGPMNDHRTFGDYLNPIADYRTLHLLDQRGCGDSDDAPADTYTLARLAEDIEDTRARLGHDRIDLLGHSYGGLIALRFALRRPEHLQTLIIAGSAARGWKGVVRSSGAWVVWGRQLLMNLKKNIDWKEYHLKHDVGNRDKVQEVRANLALPKRYDPARSSPLMNAAFGPIDVTPIARRLHAFAIFGKQDHRFVWDASYLRAKGFRVRVIDNCGHFPYIEQPERFHAIVKQALLETTPAHA
jgi:pimeloyl-ACP methyl ester carboxylesterase